MQNKYLPSEAHTEHARITLIVPTQGWRMLNWRELWFYRELLWVLTMRDIRVRYKQTVLGASWAVIRPVITMVIFSVVFGNFAKMPSDGNPYPIFVYAALLPWTYFSSVLAASGQSLVGSSHLVSKVYFPRLIIPLSAVAAGLLDLFISSAVLVALMIWYGSTWSWNILLSPILFFAAAFTALGIGTLLSALTVAYRDFNHVTPFLIQIWMYVSPVIYPVNIVPEKWRLLMYLNPVTGLIEGFRCAFLGSQFDMIGSAISISVAIVLFVLGLAYFEKVERRFADII